MHMSPLLMLVFRVLISTFPQWACLGFLWSPLHVYAQISKLFPWNPGSLFWHTHTQMGHFPRGTMCLLVIVPHHFHIPNYFNQSFLTHEFASLACLSPPSFTDDRLHLNERDWDVDFFIYFYFFCICQTGIGHCAESEWILQSSSSPQRAQKSTAW